MFLDRLFKLMAEKQASDLFISCGAPINLKVNGVVSPVSTQPMDPDTVRRIAYELMNKEQARAFESELEMNLSHLDLVVERRGLVLVAGATGSGKSTTLAAMIDHRNLKKPGHILTIEDPIEYLFEHKQSIVNQREIGIDTQNYHLALANALREAPDLIMIGEIRDKETMQ